jgi:nitroreductase/NAD-dependent dihydropyrimidine dehydrogenase PreA subunit
VSELAIHPQSCNRCGLCATVCPSGIITLQGGAPPRFIDGGAAYCIACGHCEAVCPSGCLVLEDLRLAPTDFEPAAVEMEMEPERLAGYLRMRRSIRHYREEPVARDTILRLMDVVRFAPTGHNRQDVRWLMIHDTGELRRLTGLAVDWMRETAASGSPLAKRFHMQARVLAWESGRDSICRLAPHLALAYVHEDNPVAGTDAIIALAHLDIAAQSFGLGACWGGIFLLALNNYPPLREALSLPAEHLPVHVLMLGYPEVRFQRPPKRNRADIAWR